LYTRGRGVEFWKARGLGGRRQPLGSEGTQDSEGALQPKNIPKACIVCPICCVDL